MLGGELLSAYFEILSHGDGMVGKMLGGLTLTFYYQVRDVTLTPFLYVSRTTSW